MKNRSNIILFIILIIVICSTAKYCLSGEVYTFETDAADEIIYIEEGSKISQEIIIDKKSRWNTDSYGIKFDSASQPENGMLKFTISQNGNDIQQYSLNLQEMKMEDEWYVLQGFDYSVLDKGGGGTVITIEAVEGKVGICVVDNHYNIPNCLLGEADTGKTLVQKYAVPYVNKEYILRLVLYLVLIILLLGMGCILVFCDETKSVCNIIQACLVCSFLIFIYIYNSSFYFEPSWAEAVTNFISTANTESVWKNFISPESGYFAFFQRLITVALIKILHIKSYHALFIMQFIAYIISGYMLSFFVKKNFSVYAALKERFVITMILMIQMLDVGTLTFINFYPYGIYLILLFFLSDSDGWSKEEYIGLTILSSLCCMAKGQYVVILPFVAVVFLLFKKDFKKRDRIFMLCLAISSAVQLIYSFVSPTAGGSTWVDRTDSASQNNYILKLICELLRDVPNTFLSIFEQNIYFFNGISVLIMIGFWILVILFFKKIFLKEYRKKYINKDIRNLSILFLFLCAQRLFFRLSVYGVTDYDILSDQFWSFYPTDLGSRYEVFGTFPVFLCFMIIMKILAERNQHMRQAAMAILLVCVMASDVRLQIKGLGTDGYSISRVYVSGINSEICLMKDIEEKESIVVPIRPDPWLYIKNAKVYCIGTDIFGFGAEMISDEPVENGKIDLHDKTNMDSGILQVFIRKKNLIDNSRYRIRVFDQDRNIIKEMQQDNTEYQTIASFSFEEAIYGAAGIQILNGRGEEVQIENGIYLVSSAQEEFKIYGEDDNE